ncbi:hypothetical protein KIN20_034747 [Parelaphostrongylus tenuis]|uniref:Uncharacterized protein n=1 Tax=Parelaphostrongylus tenuis TaxID=148309 RepID=A0AAD5WKA8_PARTN|nr:hypothetical protein KIN20_034747 [Parelaphostrongylus tenuis]
MVEYGLSLEFNALIIWALSGTMSSLVSVHPPDIIQTLALFLSRMSFKIFSQQINHRKRSGQSKRHRAHGGGTIIRKKEMLLHDVSLIDCSKPNASSFVIVLPENDGCCLSTVSLVLV